MSDEDTIGAMIQFGGGFVEQLARLYQSADANNRARIQTGWPEYWQQYTELAAQRRTNRPQPDATGQP